MWSTRFELCGPLGSSCVAHLVRAVWSTWFELCGPLGSNCVVHSVRTVWSARFKLCGPLGSSCVVHLVRAVWSTWFELCGPLGSSCVVPSVRTVWSTRFELCGPLGSSCAVHSVQAVCVCSGCESEGRTVLPLHCKREGRLCSSSRTTGGNIQATTQYATWAFVPRHMTKKNVCFCALKMFRHVMCTQRIRAALLHLL